MDQMCRFRHRIVLLILIINIWAIFATEKYNSDEEQIKCCNAYDKNNGYTVNNSTHDMDNTTTTIESPLLFNWFQFRESIPKLNSTCIRIKLEPFIQNDTLSQSSSSIGTSNIKYVGNEIQNYVMYCNNTSMDFIDDFISKSSGDEFVIKGQSSDTPIHLDNNEFLFGAIILINVSLNGDSNTHSNFLTNAQYSWHSTATNQNDFGLSDTKWPETMNKSATLYLSWTQSRLNGELFGAWIRTTAQPVFIHLTHLDISDNNISNITWEMFEHLPALRSLNLSTNAINNETIQYELFHRFTQLQQLDLSKNKLTSIVYDRLNKSAPLSSKSTNIVNLNYNKQTSALPRTPATIGVFTDMPELCELILSHNQMTDLPRNTFIGLPKLHLLNLANNNLSIIPFQVFNMLSALQKLDLSGNHLVTFLDNFFIKNEALIVLNLCDNMLQKILKNSLHGLTNLIELDLSNNQIANIDRNAFDSLKVLQRLNLCRNNLNDLPTTLFYKLYQLKYLNLSKNKFKILHNGIFSSQYALEYLIIDETPLQKSNNWVSRIPDEVNRDVLKRLHTISMRKNRHLREIDAVTLRSLVGVEYLNLSGNGLILLPHEIGEMVNLKQLDLSENDLLSIPKQLNGLKNLDTINMLGNRFECDCQMVWVTSWMNEVRNRTKNVTILEQQPPFNQLNELKCSHGYPGDLLRVLQQLQCYKPTVVHISESRTYLLRSDAQLECSFSGNPIPDIIWITPLNKIIRYYADPDAKPFMLLHNINNNDNNTDSQHNADLDHHAKTREKMEHQILKHKHFYGFTAPTVANEVTLLENGSLRVHNISRKDSGLYICYGYNVMGYKSAEIR